MSSRATLPARPASLTSLSASLFTLGVVLSLALGGAASMARAEAALELRLHTGLSEIFPADSEVAAVNGKSTFFEPINLPADFHPLGHYFQENDDSLDAVSDGQVAVAAGRGPGMLLIARALEPDALAMPVSYTATQVVSKSAGGTVDDGGVWRPVAPPGYACLGDAVGRGSSPPPLDAIRCVKLQHLVPGKGEPIVKGDSSKWHVSRIVPQHQSLYSEEAGLGIDTGVFKVREPVALSDPPQDVACGAGNTCYAISALAVDKPALDASTVERLIQQYGPTLRLHPNELYEPEDPRALIEEPTVLCRGMVPYTNDADWAKFVVQDATCVPVTGRNLLFEQEVAKNDPRAKNPDGSRNPDYTWWLDFEETLGGPRGYEDICGSNGPGAGLCYVSGNVDRAKAFVRVKPWNHVFVELQFWFFYSYNGGGKADALLDGTVTQFFVPQDFRDPNFIDTNFPLNKLDVAGIVTVTTERTQTRGLAIGAHYGDFETTSLRCSAPGSLDTG